MSAPVPVTVDRSSLERVVDALGDRVTSNRGDQVYARCPGAAHGAKGDRQASLSVTWKVDPDKGGRTWVHCHRSCETREVVDALGLRMTDLYDTPPARPDGSAPTYKPAPRPRKTVSTSPARPSSAGRKRGPRPAPIAQHAYARADATRTYDVLRFEPTEDWPQKYSVRRYDESGHLLQGDDRYTAPPIEERVLYRLPEVLAAVERGDLVYLVEGEKDADNAVAAGVTATTNPFGAFDTPARQARMWTLRYAEPLRGAHVVLVPDLDSADGPVAYPGFRHMLFWAEQLEGVAASIRVALPRVPKDVTDHLDAGHAIADLEQSTVEFLRAQVDSVAEPAATAPAPREAPTPSGPAEQGDAKVYDFPARTPADADQDGNGRGGGDGGGPGDSGSGSGGGSEPEWTRVVIRDRFEATDAGLFKIKFDTSDGIQTVLMTELLPVRVRLTARVQEVLGDGEEPEVTHVDLAASKNGGEEVSLPRVSRKRWEACTWVNELPWPVDFDDTQRGRSLLRRAIVRTSDPAPELTSMYGSLGWQEIDGKQRYVHAGGALDADGPVEGVRVDMPEELAPYALPAPPSTAEELTAAVDASTCALFVLPPRIAAPLLGAAYRACLGQSRSTVMLVGAPSLGKSGLSAMAVQHYAPTVRHDYLPGGGAGEEANTVANLEDLRFRAGNVLLSLDDLAPDRGPERASIRAAIIARSQYNGYGKGRQRREGGQRPRHRPRSLPLLSAEQGTTVESADSRIVSIPVRQGDVDVVNTLPMLDDDNMPHLRAVLTAAMVTHYASAMPMGRWLEETRARLAADLRDPEAEGGLDARHSDSVADLATGARAMLDMATARGALTSEQAAALWEVFWQGFVECKRHLMAGTHRLAPTDRFRELLRTLLIRGDVTLLARDGGMPDHATRLGWQKSDYDAVGWRQAGVPIGWTDGDRVWLNPGATFAALDRQASAEREPLNHSKVTLGEALANAEVLRTRTVKGIRRSMMPVRVGPASKPESVWDLPYAWLFETDAEEDGQDEPPPPPPTAPEPPPALATPGPNEPADGPERPAERPVSPSEGEGPDRQSTGAPERPARPGRPQRPEGTRGPRRRALPDFAALAAVVEAKACWLAQPGKGVSKSLEPPTATLSGLLDWLATLNLGHVDGRGVYADAPLAWGQAWLLPSMRRALKLPASLDAGARPRNQVARALAATGWEAVGEPGAWLRVRRPADEERGTPAVRLNLVVPEWFRVPSPFGEDEADARTLAARLARYTELTGMAFQWTPAVTGVQLAAVTRPWLLRRGPQDLPKVARRPNREQPFEWRRPPTPEEQRLRYAHLIDWNGLYLGAARSLPLAWGEYVHVTAPALDLDRPGYWKVRLPKWEHALLPDPFRVYGRDGNGALWISTPSLKIADLLGMRVEVEAGLLAAETIDKEQRSGKVEQVKGYGRLLDKWSAELGSARAALQESTDPDDLAIKAAVKDTYATAIGRFDALSLRETGKHPMYRPDFRHAIIAQGRYAIMRKVLAAAEHGRYPLAILTDGLVYASDSPDPESALPPGFELGTKVGQVDHEGVAPMEAIMPRLTGTTWRTSYDEDGNVKDYGLADIIRDGGAPHDG